MRIDIRANAKGRATMYPFGSVLLLAAIAAFCINGSHDAAAALSGAYGVNAEQPKSELRLALDHRRRGIGVAPAPTPYTPPKQPSPAIVVPHHPVGKSPDFGFYRGPGFCYSNCRRSHSAEYCRRAAANCN